MIKNKIYRGREKLAQAMGAMSALSYPSSALRFGLMDIKPVEFQEIFKRRGIKFRRRGIRFESLKPAESFSDFITLSNEKIFSAIPLPSRFTHEELVKYFTKLAVDAFESDKELQEAIKQLKEHKHSIGPLLTFTQFIKDRFETEIQDYYDIEAERFMRSNFPLSFFAKFTLHDNTFLLFLRILERIVRRHEILATLPGVRDLTRGYKTQIYRMKKVLSPIIDQVDVCADSESLIKKYVLIWNAKSYEELSEPEFLDIKKVDYAKLSEFQTSFQKELSKTRILLFKVSKQYFPEAFNFKIDENPTSRMIGKLLVASKP